ncbi:ribosome hibernation-promoting factor, HPF/YfiA family [Sphingomonas quercus]|uniref:Ribosome hibernation promoting factor n=1 Tax=Sphingomonas quercus TaxID=2842451 RepID=A0ABS6BF35_9SPHN|nr:ribosome-associated translation inhibitor RaiA [Sphingomonas quercus]MBU3076920.1 ribosome-associated translation inhibitor RaiA [Sphingomonas quercus]
MEIRVSGHQVDTGEALRTHVRERLEGIADKYCQRALSATVTFGRGPHDAGFVCDIVAHVMQGVILKASAHAVGQEANPAFDQAAAKIETQLRRYMRRLKARNAPVAAADVLNGFEADAGYTVFQENRDEEDAADNPLIIAETRVDIPDSSVSDAVMMLDLRNTNALLFRNSGTGAFNMVYRRGDGTIGWVEPRRSGEAVQSA